MANFFEELKKRGLIYQVSPGIEEQLKKPTTFYLGIDPTGDSLHIGHLLGFLILKRALNFGHKVIIVVGGGTSLIGDPSGKEEERPLLPREVIKKNKEKLKVQIKKIFEGKEFLMVDNFDWLSKITLTEFLREVGKYISLNSMLDLESVKSRLSRQQGISFAEFSYQLLQAYDFLILYKKYHCQVQIGGSDQWGNIIQGGELIRKKENGQAFGLSYPLIVNPKTGKKFGKTEKGVSIWLDETKTPPFAFYQFLINVDDQLASQLLYFYSFDSFEEINQLKERWEKKKEERLIQKKLAEELTSLIFGQEKMLQAKKISQILFEQKPEKLTEDDLEFIKKSLPYASWPKNKEFNIVEAVYQSGLTTSKNEARRLIEQNGIKDFFLFDRYHLLRKGRKEWVVVEIKN